MDEQFVYMDGEFVSRSDAKVSVFDHGFLYGDGVFEGIRAYNGSVFRLEEHIGRLYASAHTIMLKIPISREAMAAAVVQTIKKNGMRDAYARIVVTRGLGDLGLDPRKCPKASVIIIAGTISLLPKEKAEGGINALITWIRRDPIDGTTHEVKSLNYLNSILAKIEANNANVDEAIFLNSQGCICEGTAENIFVARGRKLLTPPTYTGALPGITQGAVVEIARQMGIQVEAVPITPHELFNADEVFLTGTAAEIIPVATVNGRVIGKGESGAVTKMLRHEFTKFAADPVNGTPCA